MPYRCKLPSSWTLISHLLQSSHMVSRSRSCLRSAPQTDHLLGLLLAPNPNPLISIELRLLNSPASLTSLSSPFTIALSLAYSSASSRAASSASGVSGMVSRELIEGERDRKDVGVLGMLEIEL